MGGRLIARPRSGGAARDLCAGMRADRPRSSQLAVLRSGARARPGRRAADRGRSPRDRDRPVARRRDRLAWHRRPPGAGILRVRREPHAPRPARSRQCRRRVRVALDRPDGARFHVRGGGPSARLTSSSRTRAPRASPSARARVSPGGRSPAPGRSIATASLAPRASRGPPPSPRRAVRFGRHAVAARGRPCWSSTAATAQQGVRDLRFPLDLRSAAGARTAALAAPVDAGSPVSRWAARSSTCASTLPAPASLLLRVARQGGAVRSDSAVLWFSTPPTGRRGTTAHDPANNTHGALPRRPLPAPSRGPGRDNACGRPPLGPRRPPTSTRVAPPPGQAAHWRVTGCALPR
jgi:hypothetical protein